MQNPAFSKLYIQNGRIGIRTYDSVNSNDSLAKSLLKKKKIDAIANLRHYYIIYILISKLIVVFFHIKIKLLTSYSGKNRL